MLKKAVNALDSFGIDEAVVVPVPLHARKLRYRGFNQSELIAQEFIKLASGKMTLQSRVLQRRRETESQIGLRVTNAAKISAGLSSFPGEEIAGRDVLLIDDVFTTGTTVSECASVLLRAGASKVFVATVARTLKHEVKGIKVPQTVGEETRPPRARRAAGYLSGNKYVGEVEQLDERLHDEESWACPGRDISRRDTPRRQRACPARTRAGAQRFL